MKLVNWLRHSNATTTDAFFTLPLELDDSRPVKVYRAILSSASLLVLGSVVWAGFTPIRELTVAQGVIVPRGEIRTIQHFEGGIIAEIYHRVGDNVHVNEPLVRMADEQTGADLLQLRSRLQSLKQHQAQLDQLILMQKQKLPIDVNSDSNLGAAQQAVLVARTDERADERLALQSRISQRKIEITNLQRQIVSLTKAVKIRTQVFNDKAALLKEGLATRRAYFDDQSALEQSKGQLLSANGQLATAQESLVEAQALLASSDATALRSWSEELSKVSADVKETNEALAKQQDRFNRLIVRSPVDGVVQFLSIKSVGEVVRGGDSFVKIVPTDVPLIAEVQIRPDDIGNVKVGNLVELKITAFDSAIYGKMNGTIEGLSPSSFQRENGEYYFKASIAIPPQKLLGNSTIAPGMVVSAEIITGAKSFLRYILKPVFKVFGPAFSER